LVLSKKNYCFLKKILLICYERY